MYDDLLVLRASGIPKEPVVRIAPPFPAEKGDAKDPFYEP